MNVVAVTPRKKKKVDFFHIIKKCFPLEKVALEKHLFEGVFVFLLKKAYSPPQAKNF